MNDYREWKEQIEKGEERAYKEFHKEVLEEQNKILREQQNHGYIMALATIVIAITGIFSAMKTYEIDIGPFFTVGVFFIGGCMFLIIFYLLTKWGLIK